MDTISTIYRETMRIGVTEDFENAYNALTANSTKDESDDVFCILADVVSAETERAFTEGFKTAVRLMMGAMS